MINLCIVWSISAVVGTAIGLVPSLRELNWLNIPFGVVGVLLSSITLATTKGKKKRHLVVSLCLSLLAVIVAVSGLVIAGVVI